MEFRDFPLTGRDVPNLLEISSLWLVGCGYLAASTRAAFPIRMDLRIGFSAAPNVDFAMVLLVAAGGAAAAGDIAFEAGGQAGHDFRIFEMKVSLFAGIGIEIIQLDWRQGGDRKSVV